MTPEQYADAYLNVTWQYGLTTYRAGMSQYLAIDPTICDPKKLKGSKEARGWLMNAIRADPDVEQFGDVIRVKGQTRTVSLEGINKSFGGKASPGQLADTMWLATHLKFITASPTDPTVPGREAARAQQYAQWYLGVDCSGFANNFIGNNREQPMIQALDSNKATRRTTIESIRSGDVMVTREIAKNKYKHIAIVVSALKTGTAALQLFTVESYGWEMAGVGKHDRFLAMSSPGVFVHPNPAKGDYEIYIQANPGGAPVP